MWFIGSNLNLKQAINGRPTLLFPLRLVFHSFPLFSSFFKPVLARRGWRDLGQEKVFLGASASDGEWMRGDTVGRQNEKTDLAPRGGHFERCAGHYVARWYRQRGLCGPQPTDRTLPRFALNVLAPSHSLVSLRHLKCEKQHPTLARCTSL